MELSILIAKILSIIYLAAGIGILIGTINFNAIADGFQKSPTLTFIAGSLGIIIGIILVEYHNIWIKNWTVLITIISWFFLFGGIIVVIFPKSLSYGKGFIENPKLLGTFMIFIGLIFGCFGFMNL